MRRQSNIARVVVGSIVVLVIAATATVVGTSDDGDDDEPATTTVELSGDALELTALLDKRRAETYHARYEGSTQDATAIAIETWQRGALVRQDQEVQSGSQMLRLSSFVLPSGQVNCVQVAAEQWTCQRAGPGQQQAVDPLAAIRQRLGEGEVIARDATVEGRPARCFELTVDSEASELCVIPSTGIPVRITGGTTELRLVLLEESVVDEIFEPPAEVAGG